MVSADQDDVETLAEPLHRQIASAISAEIGQRGLPPHSKLASEVDLAQRYGVSRGTVTKALDTLVQQGMLYRQRPRGTFVAGPPIAVADGAAAPSAMPAGQAPPIVGLLVPFLPDSFVGGIILGVETVTRAAGYALSFAYSENDWALERYHVDRFLQAGAAGVLVFPSDHAVEQAENGMVSVNGHGRIAMLRAMQRQGVPLVLIDRYVPEVDCDYVVSDDHAAGYAATQHLLALGHNRVGFLSTTPQLTSTALRCAGYVHCLSDHAVPVDPALIRHALRQAGPSSMPGGLPLPGAGQADRALVREWLSTADRPTAVVASNDYVALRVLQVADESGLRVPEDLAIVCCGGGDSGAYARVPLTSILQPAADLGRQAAHIVLDRIAGRSSGPRHAILPVSLVVRRSCGAAPRRTPLSVAHPHA